jgi:hypothetical protein
VKQPVLAHLLWFLLLSGITVSAAPPSEVGDSLRFEADGTTLSWEAVPTATGYDVYRGISRSADDLSCFHFNLPATNLPDSQQPSSLYVYLIAARNGDGVSGLGTDSFGTERQAGLACADDDTDGIENLADNCPLVSNPSQADQDENGTGDRCDPNTYTFEDDLLGQAPAETTVRGALAPGYLVRSYNGDAGVAFEGDPAGAQAAFDRLDLWQPRLAQTVWFDSLGPSGQTGTMELWSEGSLGENSGGGLRLRVDASGAAFFEQRNGTVITTLGSTALIDDRRLRIQLEPIDANDASLHLDRLDENDQWQPELSVNATATAALSGYLVTRTATGGGQRSLTRITAVNSAPVEALTILRRPDGLTDWKVFQRGPAGTATVPLPIAWRSTIDVRLEARLLDSSLAPLPGFDWADHNWNLAAAPEGRRITETLPNVPAGGNYRLEARLLSAENGSLLGEDFVVDLGVGDVWLATGQSNMSGFSGALEPREPERDEVHLFGNDYRWKRASEPMDRSDDQVDRVSLDNPAHSLMLAFANTLNDSLQIPIAIIPASLGGTNLHTQWQRNDSRADDRGTLYGSSVYRVRAQSYEHPIAGVIWYQGESDVGNTANGYRDLLRDLVNNWRSDLQAPRLIFGNVQLATYQFTNLDQWTQIQEAQRAYAVEDPLSVVIPAVDQPRADAIHLNVSGYRETGGRLGRAVLVGHYGKSLPNTPQLLSVAFTSNQRRRVALAYDKPVQGGQEPSLYRIIDGLSQVPVSSVSVDGSTVELRLSARASVSALLRYGYSVAPAADWIQAVDGSGPALAFRDLPIDPP